MILADCCNFIFALMLTAAAAAGRNIFWNFPRVANCHLPRNSPGPELIISSDEVVFDNDNIIITQEYQWCQVPLSRWNRVGSSRRGSHHSLHLSQQTIGGSNKSQLLNSINFYKIMDVLRFYCWKLL